MEKVSSCALLICQSNCSSSIVSSSCCCKEDVQLFSWAFFFLWRSLRTATSQQNQIQHNTLVAVETQAWIQPNIHQTWQIYLSLIVMKKKSKNHCSLEQLACCPHENYSYLPWSCPWQNISGICSTDTCFGSSCWCHTLCPCDRYTACSFERCVGKNPAEGSSISSKTLTLGVDLGVQASWKHQDVINILPLSQRFQTQVGCGTVSQDKNPHPTLHPSQELTP